MITDERKQILAERVYVIFRNNGLNQEEIWNSWANFLGISQIFRRLFRANEPEDSGDRITQTMEQIIALFGEEQLTIMECVDVFHILYKVKSKYGP